MYPFFFKGKLFINETVDGEKSLLYVSTSKERSTDEPSTDKPSTDENFYRRRRDALWYSRICAQEAWTPARRCG